MRLKDLSQKLYSQKSDIESRKPKDDIYDPRTKVSPEKAEPEKKETENKDWVIESATTKKQKTLLLLIVSILIGILVISVGGYFVYLYLKKDFRQQQVKVQIKAPDAVNINEDFGISIPYGNNNPVGLKDAHLVLELPDNYVLASTNPQANSTSKSLVEWNLGDLAPQKNGVLEIHGRFAGRDEDSVVFKSLLTYTPANFNSAFQNEASASTRVIGVPLTLTLEPTRTVASGYGLNYKIVVRNNGKEPFQNLSLKIKYPPGFSYINSTLPLDGDPKNIWNIPTILSNEEKNINIEGKIEGIPNEQKYISVSLGMENQDGFKEYIQKEGVTTITEPPIAIKQSVKDNKTVVHKDDEIDFTIEYANKSERAIKEAIIKVKISGVIFDYKTIGSEDGGWYDSNTGEVIWQGGKTPQLAVLAPGASGKLTFKINVANFIPFSEGKTTNFTGNTTVSIESPEMPTPIGGNKTINGNPIEFKLSTKANLQSTAFYSDGTIPNSGPIPPTVGKKTTYTVHWTLTNSFNDLRDVEVKTVLPYGVEWMNKVFPSKNGVEYRERTKEVIWNIERIPAGAGGDLPAANLVFQIGLTPSENDAGKTKEIVGEVDMKGTDSFTKEVITLKSGKLDSGLEFDQSMSEEMGTVVRPGEEINPDNPYNEDESEAGDDFKETP